MSLLWLYIGNRSVVQGVTRSDVERGTYHAEKRRGYGLWLKRRGSRNLGPTGAGLAREPADIRRGQCSSKIVIFCVVFHLRGCNAVATTTTTYNRVELRAQSYHPISSFRSLWKVSGTRTLVNRSASWSLVSTFSTVIFEPSECRC